MSIDGEDQMFTPDGASMESEWDLLPHNDIDATDDNDPQLCTIYVNEIYEYLRENEVCCCILNRTSYSTHYR